MKNIKAIFMDYTGTMVSEDGPYTKMLIGYFLQNSDFTDPETAVSLVWKLVKEYEEASYLDKFITEPEIVGKIIDFCENNYNLRGNRTEIMDIWEKTWIYAPLYDDVKTFFDICPYPVYIITNDGEKYLKKSMEDKGLSPAGIISAESVHAYKPHSEIFEEALRVSGCTKDEVLHIGDSIVSDVRGALAAGIRPVLIDRKGDAVCDEATVIHSLADVLNIIDKS